MTETGEKSDADLQTSYENENDVMMVKTVETEDRGKVMEEGLLKFLDSMDNYLTLMDSLSSILRQGWLELASARHSMGASRINPSLFDHKQHSASTTFQLNHQNVEQPHFELRKWESSSDSPRREFCEGKFEEDKLIQSLSNGLRIRNMRITPEGSAMKEKKTENAASPSSVDDSAQKERLKSLSMFGALVPPKLRAAQLSFETALETLAEVANTRTSIQRAYELVHEEMESAIR